MNRHSKLGKGRKDMYYYLAKESGFRSRAAFKLLQLEKKFGFLENSQTCLDLCAAPGGWSEVAVKNMPVGSRVIAVDLDPIKPIPGVTSFQGDITTEFASDTIKKLLNNALIDVCVHDGAPNATGDYNQDSYNQNILVLWALKLACKHLKKGGSFITKIFRTSEFLQLQYVFKQLFDTVETTKPRSSRDTSAEIFTVCRGYKNAEAPDSLFDPDVVLKPEATEEVENLEALADKLDLRVRHRVGYETELTKRYVDIVSFVVSSEPISILGEAGEICFTDDLEADYRFKEVKERLLADTIKFNRRAITSIEEYMRIQEVIRKLTPADVEALFEDIKVLSKKDLREILKWRELVLSEVCNQTVVSEIAELKEFQVDNEKAEATENAATLQEQELRNEMLQREKEAIKRARKLDRRQARKLANFDAQNVNDYASLDRDLFSLADVEEGAGIEEVIEPEESVSENEQDADIVRIGKEEINMQLDQHRYFDELDQNMEIYYENYQNVKKKRERHISELRELEMRAEGHADINQAAEMWFKQQEFTERESEEDLAFGEEFPLPKEALLKTKAHEKRVKTIAREARELGRENRDLDRLREEHKVGNIAHEEEKDFVKEWERLGVRPQEIELMEREDREPKEIDEEEEENTEESFSHDNEPFDENVDQPEMQPQDEADKGRKAPKQSIGMMLAKQNLDVTATKVALATCMTTKKSRRELEESAYNKNTFYLDDQDSLPKWFLNEELEHNEPVRPLTSEEISEIKQKLAELNQRPRTKKEREALARKRMRAHIKMTALEEKTQEIINREDLTEREKVRQLKKMQSATVEKAAKKRIVYSNLNKDFERGGKVPRNVKLVDKRGKKDLRQAKIRERRGY